MVDSDHRALLPSVRYRRNYFFRESRRALEQRRLRRSRARSGKSQALLYPVRRLSRCQLRGRITCFFGFLLVKKTLVFCLLVGLAWVFYQVDPERSAWVPKCPFYYATGWQCPACGTQRAIHQLLHLHLREAVAYNAFLFVSFPYLALLIGTECAGKEKKQTRLGAFCHDRRVVCTYLALIIVWWIGRNC